MSLFQDWANNFANPKGRLVMALFRIAFALRNGPKPLMILAIPYGVLYRIFVEWMLGIELPWKTRVGPGLRIEHGQCLVINDQTVFGRNCMVRNATTIGNKQLRDGTYSGAPVIGDFVDIGANVVILGEIQIGDHAVIGAGSVVVKDVPAHAVVVGNPARVVRMIDR
ncbi:MAG TPA: serine acetyltransferase [Chthoniobacteraceae bacterium]|jgi:putative colanic acid biosynthesis acetyltransferase WcaB|nr:serine acetyltransferase [Chthoniobacteraceae bacterium]